MSKHEHLVNQIAEDMARKEHPDVFNRQPSSFVDVCFNQQEQEGVILHFIPSARIAVKHMAEMYEQGWFDCNISDITERYKSEMMMDRGLIPQTGEEAGEK